ncbi:MAG: Fe-S cluster assembly protein SufD [Hyphomicrobiales bacterium]|nr:MAG: Fe-S cluster assembly protein SufD [Hyphomicrobiales bacterium]
MTVLPNKIQTQGEASLAACLDGLELSGVRAEARAFLLDNGLPNRRIEEWKYTDLRGFLKEIPPLAQSAEAETATPVIPADVCLSVINGVCADVPASLPQNVSVQSGITASSVVHKMPNTNVALNVALASQGYAIEIGQSDKTPIIYIDHKVVADEPVTSASRHNVVVKEGAKAILIERFGGPDGSAYLNSVGMSVDVAKNAHFVHIRILVEGDEAIHMGVLAADIAEDAIYEPFVMSVGSKLTRSDLQITFNGERSHGGIRGATLIKGKQHTDMTLMVDHAAPNCTSVEQFKSVIADEAIAVFQGKIMVKQIAQKTDAKMMSQGLLLSESGAFLNKPELEIFADDVVCGHGATCGDLNEDYLFYLLSRGVPRAQAETMLIQAFVAETIEAIEQPEIVEALEAILSNWLVNR